MQSYGKALSVRQPWAWFILHGGKDVENRSWPTKYRGPLLIHASKFWDEEEIHDDARYAAAVAKNMGGIQPGTVLTLRELKEQQGGIVGQVNLIDCIQGHTSPWANLGCWHWMLEQPKALPFRPYRGTLGIFNVARTSDQ